MLKLIYTTGVFGPIDLDFGKPVITVGSAPDNDLVLDHPSILPNHCQLVFRDEKVLILLPEQPADDCVAIPALQELGIGETLRIGELEFDLDHSLKTVAVHVASASQSEQVEDAADGPRYYCPKCQKLIPGAEVKRVGLVGHSKRELCPRCSGVLQAERTKYKV